MNKAYRLIWSRAKDAWVVAAEIVKGNGGPPPITVSALMVAAWLALASGGAQALPVAPTVLNGTVSFATSGNTLTVTNSPNSIINWQGFSIAAGERTAFNQQNAASAVLNRVVGSYRSDIFGMLDSNGRVFLINPNGILFGAGSQINVAGLVASSLGMSNNDFLNGSYRFSGGAQSGSVINEGSITTLSGGKVWLIAPRVENRGVISSPQGDVILAAGQQVYLVDPDNPEIAVVVSAPTDQALNLGTITARAGKVGIYGGLVTQSGVISADGAEAGPGGRIFLKSTNATTLSAGSSTSATGGTNGGSILVQSSGGAVAQAGSLTASGDITLSADSMSLSGATAAPNVSIVAASGYRSIDLGTKTAGALGLTAAELNTITAANLNIGDVKTNTNDISISAAVTVTGAGNLNLTANTISQNAVLSAPGSISLSADTMHLSGGAGSITAPIVSLTRRSYGFIDLGSAYGGYTLVLTQGDLDSVTASSALRIGDLSNTFGITVSAPISRTGAGNDTLHLISNGGIDQFSTAPLTVTNLALEARGNISLTDPANSITNLAAAIADSGFSGYGGSISIADSKTLTVGSVDGLDGLQAGSSIMLAANGLDITRSISAPSVNLSTATGSTPIDLGALDDSGKLGLSNAELNLISTPDLNISTTSGNITVSNPVNITHAGNLNLYTCGAFNQAASLGLPGGTIRATADSMSLSGGIIAETVYLARATSGAIDLGGAGSAGTLGLTGAELGTITAGTLNIGDTWNTTGMTVSSAVNLADVGNLNLSTGGTFGQTAALSAPGTVSVHADAMNLSTEAGKGISSSTVNLARANWGDIDLGSKTTGTLGLTQNELANITATDSLNIGDNWNTNILTISNLINLTNANRLSLFSYTAINQNSAVSAPNISLTTRTYNQVASLNATGSISIAANAMSLTGGISAPDVNLTRYWGGNIDLGGPDNTINGTLGITQAELDTITASNALRIGDSSSVDGIYISSPITWNQVNQDTLHLVSGGSITQAPAGDLTVTNLALEAAGSITLTDPNNAISNLAANSTNGSISLASGNPLTITAFDGVSGVQANSGDVALKMDDLTITQGISAKGVTLTPLTPGTTIDVGSKTEGSLSLTQAELDLISAATLNIGDSASGNLTVSASTDVATSGTIGTLNLTSGGTIDQTASLSAANIGMTANTINQDALLSATDTIGMTAATINQNEAITAGKYISMATDSLNLSGVAGSVLAPTVALMQLSNGTNITLDSNGVTIGTSPVAAWNNISAATRIIGSSGTGNIDVNDTDGITTNVNSNLKLISGYGGGVTSIKTALSVGANNLTLSAANASQYGGAIITAGGLELLGGTFTLNEANQVGILAGSTGSLSFTNSGDFSIGHVGNSYGLAASNTITLSTPGTVSQSEAISASALELLGTGGVYNLTNFNNLVGTLAGYTGSVTLDNNQTLLVGTVNSTIGLTTTGDIDLTARGGAGQDGIVVNAPLTAANIRLNGTGGDGRSWCDGSCSGEAGGTGVTVSSSISANGDITIIGRGGNGGRVYAYSSGADATGGDGGTGIRVNNGGSISSNGTGVNTIRLEGTGGSGGYGIGGRGGDGGEGSSGGSGGSGTGGSGGSGINIDNGSVSSSSAAISLSGTGGNGGSGFGGDGGFGGNSNYNGIAGGSGGAGAEGVGGSGGSGVFVQSSSLHSDSGNIGVTGSGGSGGSGLGGFGGAGGRGGDGFSGFSGSSGGAGGSGATGSGGQGGAGVSILADYGGSVETSDAGISLTGTGGAGGNGFGGFGGNGGMGAAGGKGYPGDGGDGGLGGSGGQGGPGGNGGDAYGGSGGSGINISAAVTTRYSGSIFLNGSGGAGGSAFGGSSGLGGVGGIGGAGGIGSSGFADGTAGSAGNSGNWGYAGEGYGGYGGGGVLVSSALSAAGSINVTVLGGNGGDGSDGFGGFAGGFAYASGGNGGGGFELQSSGYRGMLAGADITVTGIGGNGGNATGSSAASGSGNNGGNASGGSGGTGVHVNSSTLSGNSIKLAVMGGFGGSALAGTGDGSTSGGIATPGTNAPGFEFVSSTITAGDGTGTVTITTPSPASQISVGTGTAGGLGIADSSLAGIQAGTIQIGDSSHSGSIVLDGNFNPGAFIPGLLQLQLQTTGSVADAAGGPYAITAPLLTVTAGTGISLLGANQVSEVFLSNNTSGKVAFKSAVTGGLTAHLATGATDLNSAGVLAVNGFSGNLTTTSAGLTFGSGATIVNGNLNAVSSGTVAQTGTLGVSGTSSINSGSSTIILDNAGNDFVGTLTVTGGTTSLRDANALTAHLATGTTDLTAAGTLTVDGTSGSLTTTSAGLAFGSGTTSVTGNLNATSSGDVTFAAPVNAGTGSVSITSGGDISGLNGASSIIAAIAQLHAQTGIGPAAPFQTTVGQLGASNTSNAVQLVNLGVLTVTGITNGGAIQLDNQGALTLDGPVQSTGSTVTITAHSPLTTNTGADILGNGTVTLFAGASGSANDNLNVNSKVTSQNSDVILKAGESVIVNGTTLLASENVIGNSSLSAPTGRVIVSDHLNSSLPPLLTTQTVTLLPGVNEVVNYGIFTLGRESTDLTETGEDTTHGEGGQYGTEPKSLPNCN